MKHLPNLLIVDDSEENLALLENVIRKAKVNLIKAHSGLEALEKTTGIQLALAIIDVYMPEMNGYELAVKLNLARSAEKVPIIFLTASHVSEIQVFEGYKSGAVDYIVKPVDTRILLNKIQVFLDLFNQKQTITQDAILIKKSADELARVHAALIKNEEKYRSYIDNAPDGVFIVNETGKYIEVNDAACRITGYSKEVLLTMSISDITPQESLKDGLAHFRKVVHSGASKEDLMFRHQTGAIRWWTVEAVRLSESRFLGFAKDITERRQTEDNLKQTSARLALAARAGGVGVWELDFANKHLIWDDHMLMLYGADKNNFSNAYESWLAGVHPDDKARGDLEIQMAFNGEKEFDTEFRVVWPDSSVHNIRALAIVIRNDAGNALRMIGTNWDITDQKKLEEKLKSSEANFRTFFETMNDLIVVGDTQGKIIYTNHAVTRKLGYTTEELQSMTVPELYPSNQRTEAIQIFTDMFAGKRDFCPLPLARKDGSLVPVETRVWSGKWNEKDCIFGISKDLSAEQEALQKFNKIFENNPTLVAISSVPELVFTDVNSTFLSKTGYSKEEVIGKTVEDLGLFVQPEKQQFAAAELERSGTIHNFPLQIKTKSGGILEGLFSGELMESQGKQFFLTVMVDISNLTQAEQTMKVSEEKYKTMLNASPDGIIIIDTKGIITEVSEIGFELFGANSRDDLVGKDFLRFVPLDEKNTITDIIEKTMNEGLVQNIGLKIRKKNQSLFAAETSVTLIQDPKGEPLAYMIIIRDISYRQKMEAKQVHADRMANLGEMASGIAHEINQPLNIISMVMDKILFETARTEIVDVEFLKNKSDKIFENITRMRNIIDHIRAFSRSHDDYVSTAFDINSSIKNAASMMSEQLKHLGINLNLQLSKQIPALFGNTYKFEQVIINLLVNAKDAVLEKKSKQADNSKMIIEIRSYQENQNIIVEVTDNGIGIKSDDINNILLPFYTTKDEGKGTGLGLSICYQILKEMNGTIEITSDGTNGTKIKLELDIQKKNQNGNSR